MDPKEWYKSMPIVTKTLLTSCMVMTVGGNLGLFNPYSLILSFPLVWQKFQIWRLVTAVAFFGKLGFPFLINMYFMYSYSLRLETGLFDRKTADYIYMIFVNWVVLLIAAYFLDLMIIGLPLVISILYVWCAVNADQIVSFWFGTKFPAQYLPWVLAAFSVLMGGSGIMELIGIFVGHVYFFLKFKYPVDFGGVALLETPGFLQRWFPEQVGGVAGFGEAPASRRPAAPEAPTRRNWGQGYRLGRE